MKYFFIVLLWLVSFIVAFFIGKHSYANTVVEMKKRGDRFMSYYYLLTYWVELKQKGKSLKAYFDEKEYKKVIIYGYGPIGKRLEEEIKNTNVNICLIVDSNLAEEDISLGRIEDLERQVADVIVVTPTFAYKQIKANIENKVRCPIISLDEVVYSIE